MANLRDWSSRCPDLREELEAEIAARKLGRQKPLRYQNAIEKYLEAVKSLEEIISKTDPNILCQRLNEIEDNCHERELIRTGLAQWVNKKTKRTSNDKTN